jgi:hypothetical protein
VPICQGGIVIEVAGWLLILGSVVSVVVALYAAWKDE